MATAISQQSEHRFFFISIFALYGLEECSNHIRVCCPCVLLTVESHAEPPALPQPQQQQSEPVPSTSSSCATVNVDDSAESCKEVCIICIICVAYQN